MNDFQYWAESNKEKIDLLSRSELTEFAFSAGIDSTKQKPPLEFKGREITDYELKTELTLENQNGFEIHFKHQETWITQEEVQTKINKYNGINIVDWIQSSQEGPCVIEFSKGDVIDYADLTPEEGASCQCSRSFIAIVKQSLKLIEIIEVIENGS